MCVVVDHHVVLGLAHVGLLRTARLLLQELLIQQVLLLLRGSLLRAIALVQFQILFLTGPPLQVVQQHLLLIQLLARLHVGVLTGVRRDFLGMGLQFGLDLVRRREYDLCVSGAVLSGYRHFLVLGVLRRDHSVHLLIEQFLVLLVEPLQEQLVLTAHCVLRRVRLGLNHLPAWPVHYVGEMHALGLDDCRFLTVPVVVLG